MAQKYSAVSQLMSYGEEQTETDAFAVAVEARPCQVAESETFRDPLPGAGIQTAYIPFSDVVAESWYVLFRPFSRAVYDAVIWALPRGLPSSSVTRPVTSSPVSEGNTL